MKVVAQHYTGTTEEWRTANPKLYEAVWGFEKTTDGKVLAKLGNGRDLWNELKYFDAENIHGLPEQLQEFLSTALQAVNAEEQTRLSADQGLQAAISAETQARYSADQGLQAAINSEITARMNRDIEFTKICQALQTKNDEFQYLAEYLILLVESKFGPLNGAIPLATEGGDYLVTENGDYLVAA